MYPYEMGLEEKLDAILKLGLRHRRNSQSLQKELATQSLKSHINASMETHLGFHKLVSPFAIRDLMNSYYTIRIPHRSLLG
jgi:hypothetical protein